MQAFISDFKNEKLKESEEASNKQVRQLEDEKKDLKL